MPKHRMDRINEEMKKEVAEIISNEIRDPRIKAMVSVTAVVVTADLKYAKIYLSIFGTDKTEEKETLAALNKAKGFIRKRLSATVNLRNTPELTLIQDTTIDYGMHIDGLLRDLAPKTGSDQAATVAAAGEASLQAMAPEDDYVETEEELYSDELEPGEED